MADPSRRLRTDLVNRFALALVGALSFGWVTTVNRLAGKLFPGIPWLPDSCMASAVACLGIYLAIRPERRFSLPAHGTSWRRVGRLGTAWLLLWWGISAASALVAGHWIRYGLAVTAPQIVAFLILGPLQEELLFRGAIFELAERSDFAPGPWPPVLISTLFFSLHHFQLHGYAVTRDSVAQVAFTLPMGLVFGFLRAETRSLWPPLAVHVLTNLPGAFGSR